MLGYKDLYPYDAGVTIGKSAVPVYTLQDAERIIQQGLSVLGKKYTDTLAEIFAHRWIDAYPSANKATGAYAVNNIDKHPAILMNFTGDYYSLSTLAHELGHAVHIYWSHDAQQSACNRAPTSLVTEVASTTNEELMYRYMIDHAANDSEKLFFVQHEISFLHSTFFSQVRYADFERSYHALSEKNETLTADVLDNLYTDTYKIYSPGYSIPSGLRAEAGWSYVPHFYYNYYVYSYAIDICLACSVAERISAGDQTTLENYRKFLTAGNSDSSVNLFKSIGVDITKPGFAQPLIKRYNELLDMEEQLLK